MTAVKGVAAGMTATLRDDAHLHHLWYDLRSQSLFEPSFETDVTEIDGSLERMIWRIVTSYAALTKVPLRVTSPLGYAIFDGIFQQALRKHIHGDASAAAELSKHVEQALIELVPAR